MLTIALAAAALINPNPGWDPAWPLAEGPILTEHVQLTFPGEFAKAGEAYFGPDDDWIIFQAVPAAEGGEGVDPHYSMFVAGVAREGGAIVGLGHAFRVSPRGSANTCGWPHPIKPYHFLYGTTLTPPGEEEQPGYRRGTSTYSWSFPREMEIVTASIDPEFYGHDGSPEGPEVRVTAPEAVFERDGYDAEASWSPDGRHILYTHVAPPGDIRAGDGDLWVYDTRTDAHTPLVVKRGYDGGPFFSPDGKRICWRSDRRGDNLLQVFVADLVFAEDGAIVDIANETQVTRNEHVNWCPFFTRDGKYLLYATSELGHGNYEVFAVSAEGGERPRPRLRVTRARGFDGLPAFSADGRWLMWTAQRGAFDPEATDRPSSQLWAARYDHAALVAAYEALVKAERDREAAEGFDAYQP